MKHLMHILMLSCLKATELIEMKFHVRLSIKERIQLRMHLIVCDKCAHYKKQSEFLEKGLQHLATNQKQDNDLEDLKLKINQKINKLNA